MHTIISTPPRPSRYRVLCAAALVVMLAFAGAAARAAQLATQAASAATAPADDPRDLALLKRMTLEEKVNQLIMFGHGAATGPDNAGRPTNKTLDEFVREGIGSVMSSAPTGHAKFANRLQRIAVKESRLGIPIVFATDIIHGFWTTFPVPLGMAATWDPEDARLMGRISGLEGYAGGERWTFAPMLDHPADPRWGRVVETFGEAPLLASDYGVAVIQGFHGSLKDQPGVTAPYELGVATCGKHFLGYGAVQGGKDYAYVDLSERTWREYHLPTFAAAIAAGVPSIMPAFTTGPGGVPMTANKRVLQDLARDELGFRGVYVSDYAAITELRYHGVARDDLEAAVKALRDGGLTVDMEDGVYWAQLKRAVESGRLPVDLVDREVLRVLAFKRRLGLFDNPYFPEDLEARVRLAPAHRAAALAIARKSIVLLKNDAELLPLAGKRRILVTGPLADSRADLLGAWAGLGEPRDVIGVLQGIREKAAGRSGAKETIDVVYSEGSRIDDDGKSQSGDEERIAKAVALAKDRDVIIAVVGERASMTGEARNRTRLDLPGMQQQLVDALVATGKPVVVVLLTGRPLAVPGLVDRSHALVHAFFPGIEGGHAIADVLFGDYNPGGKEPITWPRSVGQLPIHHYDRPNGRPNLPERGEYGARWMDEVDAPLFPFGYGLSYSRFALDALEVPQSVRVGDDVVIRVRVANAGQRDGDETPQLYVRPRVASTVNGLRLQGYRRVHVEAGQSRVVEFRFPSSRLAIYDPLDQLRVEPGVYEVRVGFDAGSGIAGSFRLCERSASACGPGDSGS